MRKDADGLPTVSQTSLGVRPGVDIDLDTQNDVVVNRKGMSVSPSWRFINVNRIPRRLRQIVPGAAGSNNTFCFRTGSGAFESAAFANGLALEPDSATHGNIAPVKIVPFTTYESDIAATRPDWQVDET